DYHGAWLRSVAVPLSSGIAGVANNGVATAGAEWLAAFEQAAGALAPLSTVEAVVISGNGPTVIPVTGEPGMDSTGLFVPAGASRLWLDRRAEEESRIVSEAVGDFVDAGFFLPKILAIKRREEELYQRTKYFLGAPEFLAYALTGEARMVFPSEGFTRWYWDRAALEKTGLDAAKMPPFISPGETTGILASRAASRFGFSPGTRVIAGGPDFFVSILGAAVTGPGQCCDRSGSSEGINVCTAERIIDPRLMSYGHPIPGLWNLSGIISTTGMAVSWARELLGLAAEDYGAFFARAEKAAAGAGGVVFLPYLAGERAPVWDPRARGVLMGLSLTTGREEAARAVAEGVCYAIRDVAEVMESCGADIREFRVSGGAAESRFLNQLKADITGRPVLVPARREAELAGLAAIGAAAMGKYASFAEAALATVRMEAEYLPHPAHARIYEAGFARYRELYRSLKGLF
ncbi:MAG: hypothetical protein LBC88_09985, partial [Spirochaetaceae bacterium]|nr:hypothetical protein [Spirochaetaceae bacterium]